jgi:tetratricopeptide (TPR) repeat protein
MKWKHIILLLLLALVAPATQAQDDDLSLAEYYYNEQMFEQAKMYFEKIYKTNKTAKVFNSYLNTLVALQDEEGAVSLAKKKIKEDKDAVNYVKLGGVYSHFNRAEEATEAFDQAIKKVTPTRSNIILLANEFALINQSNYALQAYEKGRTEGKDGYGFEFEIASMKGALGDIPGMTDTFLDLLVREPAYLQTIQNALNRTLNVEENPANFEMLKGKTLKRLQATPDASALSEMLIWLFVQKRDFKNAFTQVSALDKRLGEQGARVYELAHLAVTNHDYESASKCFQYIVDLGANAPFYNTAQVERLDALGKMLEDKQGPQTDGYRELESAYLQSLELIRNSVESAQLLRQLAHIQAFRLNKSDIAITNLRNALQTPGLPPIPKAECKLELGDVLLFVGERWEASLLYSQVELDFKENPIGHEAKFRNARISYFSGDFEWAQSQLDVLKASTSKLISNDAIDLSLLITDNFNMDTVLLPMQQYARADLLAFQFRYAEANQTLDSILTEFPSHSLTDEIKMLQAKMCMQQGKYAEAKKLYQYVIDFHFADITADDALFALADMAERIDQDKESAMKLYERILTDFSGSLYVVEARKRFRALRGDQLE